MLRIVLPLRIYHIFLFTAMADQQLSERILIGLERLSEVFKSMLWEKAKVHGISPIQIQILLFVANHRQSLCNVSYLAKELNITKATVSDAVRILLKKAFVQKDVSETDKRRYNLILTETGQQLVRTLTEYSEPLIKELDHLPLTDQQHLYQTLLQLIHQLNQQGVIQVQRSCFNCAHYQGDQKGDHYCQYLQEALSPPQVQLDCPDFAGGE